jgi:2-oxoglutarate ferredoxin oxidoreductase subunit delta
MSNSEIIINEELCQGCGYCVQFCPKGCIAITGRKFTPQGYLVPSLVEPEKCSACGICAWMCPAIAIEVYRWERRPAEAADLARGGA